MTSVEFCYFLQGLFELAEPTKLNEKQTDLIKRHLAMVFHHEIDPSYKDTEALTEIHEKKGVFVKPPIRILTENLFPPGTPMRC